LGVFGDSSRVSLVFSSRAAEESLVFGTAGQSGSAFVTFLKFGPAHALLKWSGRGRSSASILPRISARLTSGLCE
jgi:hypothetical protein